MEGLLRQGQARAARLLALHREALDRCGGGRFSGEEGGGQSQTPNRNLACAGALPRPAPSHRYAPLPPRRRLVKALLDHGTLDGDTVRGIVAGAGRR